MKGLLDPFMSAPGTEAGTVWAQCWRVHNLEANKRRLQTSPAAPGSTAADRDIRRDVPIYRKIRRTSRHQGEVCRDAARSTRFQRHYVVFQLFRLEINKCFSSFLDIYRTIELIMKQAEQHNAHFERFLHSQQGARRTAPEPSLRF